MYDKCMHSDARRVLTYQMKQSTISLWLRCPAWLRGHLSAMPAGRRRLLPSATGRVLNSVDWRVIPNVLTWNEFRCHTIRNLVDSDDASCAHASCVCHTSNVAHKRRDDVLMSVTYADLSNCQIDIIPTVDSHFCVWDLNIGVGASCALSAFGSSSTFSPSAVWWVQRYYSLHKPC